MGRFAERVMRNGAQVGVFAIHHEGAGGRPRRAREVSGRDVGRTPAMQLVQHDVQQDRHFRGGLLERERRVALIHLHHGVLVAESTTPVDDGNEIAQHASRDVARALIGEEIHAVRLQDRREHLGRRALAIRPRHDDQPWLAQDARE